MDKAEDPLLKWFYGRDKTERRGNVQRFDRAEANIYTYSYRFRLDGQKKSKSFYLNPHHVEDLEIAQTAIRKIEAELRLIKKARLLGLKMPTPAEKSAEGLTLLALLKWHLEEILAVGRAVRTARTYEYCFKIFIEWAGGENVLVRAMQLRQIYEFYAYLRKNGNSIVSADTVVQRVRFVFAHAKRKQIIPESPFADYVREIVPESAPCGLLTIEEMRTIAQMIKSSSSRYRRSLWLAWVMACMTGMDGASVRRLRYENIDLKNRAITFKRVKRRKNPWVTIPIHWKLAKILSRHAGRTGHIFPFYSDSNEDEKRLTWSFRHYIKKLKGKGFKGMGTHMLRHSFNHILEQHDVPYEYQCYLLGHVLERGGEHKKYMHPETAVIFGKLRDMVDALPF